MDLLFLSIRVLSRVDIQNQYFDDDEMCQDLSEIFP